MKFITNKNLKKLILPFLLLASVKAAAEPKQFVLVGVAGYGTKKANILDIESNDMGPDGRSSGVWVNLPSKHDYFAATENVANKIYKTVFLIHDSNETDIPAVIDLFKDQDGLCNQDLGLAIMANSWGAGKAAKLAKAFSEQCQRQADLFVMVDGVNKPIPAAFNGKIVTQKCINYYQINASLHGGPLANCVNVQLLPQNEGGSLVMDHIEVEDIGSRWGRKAILGLLNEGQLALVNFAEKTKLLDQSKNNKLKAVYEKHFTK